MTEDSYDWLDYTCDKLTRRGMCNRPLGENGFCDREADHIEDEFVVRGEN